MNGAARRAAPFILIHIFLFAILAWSYDDPLTIRVDFKDDRFVAEVTGIPVEVFAVAPLPPPSLDLYLEGNQSPVWTGTVRDWTRWLLAPLLWMNTEQGWQSVAIFDQSNTVIASHDFRKSGLDGWTNERDAWSRGILGDVSTPWTGFLGSPWQTQSGQRIEAVLQRGGSGGGMLFGSGESGSALLLVRPHHRDILWWQMGPFGWNGPVSSGYFLRPWDSALKELLRLLLRPYLVGAALLMVAYAMGIIWTRASALAVSRKTSALSRAFDCPEDDPREVLPVLVAPIGSGEGGFRMTGGIAWPLVLGLAFGLFVVATWIADTLLERIPHVQDDVAYLFQARIFALGQLWVPTPRLPQFFEQEFIVMREGRWFAKYPPGFPAILTLGVIAGVPWLVNPILGGMTAIATYRLGAKTAGHGVGLLAALLLTLSPFVLGLSGSYMAHTAGLLFAILFALAYVAADRGSRFGAILAGAAIGVDFLIRPWTAILIAIPFMIDLLIRIVHRPRSGIARGLLTLLGSLPFLGIWLAYNTILAGGPLTTTMELWWSFDRLGFGADKGLGGHSALNGLYNSLRNLSDLSTHSLGWPSVFAFTFAAIPFVSRQSTRWDWIWLSAWFSLMIGYFFWWADGIMFGPRFYFESMAFIVLLSARGIAILSAVGRWPGVVMSSVALVTLITHNLILYLPEQLVGLNGYNYVSRRSVNAVERLDIHNALVFVDPGPPTDWWNYGMVFSSNQPLLNTDVIYARDLGPRNTQLMELYPDRSYYRLLKDQVTPMDASSSISRADG